RTGAAFTAHAGHACRWRWPAGRDRPDLRGAAGARAGRHHRHLQATVSRMLRTACQLAAVCCLLAGCATRAPLLESSAGLVELADTPFFPQDRYQCGPAALATVLVASGVDVTPDDLVAQVYVPARRGSLTIEMQAAPRRYDRLAYPLKPEFQAIIAELDAGRPVLVLHNYGLPSWPRWHYAVVIGYDAARQRVLLRSGTQRRQAQRATHFMRAWDNG